MGIPLSPIIANIESSLPVKKRPAPAKELGAEYNIPCSNCNWNNVGEISRPIEKRRKEHEKKVRDFDVARFEIARHVSEMGHTVISRL